MRILKYLILIAGLAGAVVALFRELRDYAPRPNPPSHSTVNVVATAIPVPQPSPAPAVVTTGPEPSSPPKLRDVGFNGIFEGMSGLLYQFEQTGRRVDLFVLNPDGRRRYVGTAYDEGAVLRFDSFYSPTYEQWGNFPAMHRRGDTLVAANSDGVEIVYFRRAG